MRKLLLVLLLVGVVGWVIWYSWCGDQSLQITVPNAVKLDSSGLTGMAVTVQNWSAIDQSLGKAEGSSKLLWDVVMSSKKVYWSSMCDQCSFREVVVKPQEVYNGMVAVGVQGKFKVGFFRVGFRTKAGGISWSKPIFYF